jgi:hypothetical protein
MSSHPWQHRLMVRAAAVLVGVNGPASAGAPGEIVSRPIQNEAEKLASEVSDLFGHAGADVRPDPPIVDAKKPESRLMPAVDPTRRSGEADRGELSFGGLQYCKLNVSPWSRTSLRSPQTRTGYSI